MTQQEINKMFEGRWRIKGFDSYEVRQLSGQTVQSLCRDFFQAGILLAAKEATVPDGSSSGITTVPDGSPSGESDPLADFDFFDEERPQFLRLQENEVSLNFNSGSFRITFNMPVSKEIVKTDMKCARLAKAKSGDICLILNRTQGARVSKSASSNGSRFNTTINSKDICTKLRTLLNVRSDYSVLNITRLPSTTDYIIFKITKQ